MNRIREHCFTLDWLSFTFSWKTLRAVGIEVDDFTQKYMGIMSYFRKTFPEFDNLLPEMITLEHGRFGYDNALSFNNEIMIMSKSESLDDFGVFVTVPSQGLYKLGEIFNLPDFNQDFYDCQKLFQILLSRGAKITRLDICYDDYKKHLTPGDWTRLFESGYIECKTRHTSAVNSPSGSTFYLGKRGKNKMLRVYDKCGESHGEIDAIRYEFEMKNEFAYNFADTVAQGLKITFLDILDTFCTIHDEPVANVSLQGSKVIYEMVQSWYKRQVGGILEAFEALREDIRNCSQNAECCAVLIRRVPQQYNFYKRKAWIRDYISKSLLKYVAVVGYDDLFAMIDKARDKLTEEDKAQIRHDLKIFEYDGYDLRR